MRIVTICGSLRNNSFNRALLRAAEKCLPEGIDVVKMSCGPLPLYNEDLDGPVKPEPVHLLKEAIQASDALLLATPEYNHSIPGVLKNAIDWASRPAYESVLAHKPAAILSASKGTVGGARAQEHLRRVLASALCSVYPAPEFLVPQATDKFDTQGCLKDADTTRHLRKYLFGFVIWAGKHRSA